MTLLRKTSSGDEETCSGEKRRRLLYQDVSIENASGGI